MAQEWTRRNFLKAGAGTMAAVSFIGSGGLFLRGGEAQAVPLSGLEVFERDYPRSFFFVSQIERDVVSGTTSYEEWRDRHLPFNGILSKVLSEERAYSETDNLPVLRRYKAENPGKLLLLYYNGRGRGATSHAGFFAGHWLYYGGTKLTRAASASGTVLHVGQTSAFSMGRYGGSLPDDVVISSVGPGGKPDWRRVEYARLKKINPKKGTITVQRGAYDTRPLSAPKGAYVAAHVMSGAYPAGSVEAPFWSYNYSTVCPRDADGRTGAEAFAAYLAGKLGPGGRLEAFDGITFDAFDFVPEGRPAEAIDANGDGRGDGALFGGVNAYGLGTSRFAALLRERLPGKVILADCTFPDTLQRSFGQLNGVESEGYPDLFDVDLDNTSKATNVFGFWKENSASPSLNYVNFKYRQSNPPKDRNTFQEPNLSEDESYRKLRLALASAQFSDAAFTHTLEWAPPQTLWVQGNTQVRVFDELWRGTDQEPNWLGQPKGPAVSLAAEAPDLLDGQGTSWPSAFVGRFEGAGVAFERSAGPPASMVVKATSTNTSLPVLKRTMIFALPGIQVPGEDLFVSLRLSANPLKGYPTSVARRVSVTASRGTQKRGSFTWAGGEPFTATFYFRNIGPGPVDLGFTAEGDAPVRFFGLTARSAADAAYREFENGVVFVNNSTRPHTFEVGQLFPEGSFRRIQGSDNQDPATNDGQLLGATLTLGPKDALFAARIVG